MILPDLLVPQLDLVFCGTAPSAASRAARAYYAHPGNIFWKTLFACGLTAELLHAKQYAELLHGRIGLTDLNKTESGADAELSAAAFGVDEFRMKLLEFQPKLVGFTSKFAAQKYFGRQVISYGLQMEMLEGTRFFVLPSPSGRARRYFDAAYWHDLAQLVRI